MCFIRLYEFHSAVIDVLSSSTVVWGEVRGKSSKLSHWVAALSLKQS